MIVPRWLSGDPGPPPGPSTALAPAPGSGPTAAPRGRIGRRGHSNERHLPQQGRAGRTALEYATVATRDEKWSVLPAFACFAVGGWVWARFQLRGLTLRRPQEGVERGQGGVGPGAQLGLGLSAENGQPSARRVIRSLSSPIQPTTTKPAMSLSQAASAIKQAVAPTFSSSSSSLVRQTLISQG